MWQFRLQKQLVVMKAISRVPSWNVPSSNRSGTWALTRSAGTVWVTRAKFWMSSWIEANRSIRGIDLILLELPRPTTRADV